LGGGNCKRNLFLWVFAAGGKRVEEEKKLINIVARTGG